jgi:hypothetical protein
MRQFVALNIFAISRSICDTSMVGGCPADCSLKRNNLMTDANVASDAANSSKKPRLVNRFFLDSEGKPHSRATPEGVSVVHEWKDGGYKLQMNLSDLSPEVIKCAALFGISQVVGNAYGGETDTQEAQEKAESRWNTLTDGRWATERESGPRTGDLVEAYAKAFADAGKPVTDEWKKSIAERLESGELDAKESQKNPRIKAAMDAIKLKRAQERAAKSAAAAAESSELPSI